MLRLRGGRPSITVPEHHLDVDLGIFIGMRTAKQGCHNVVDEGEVREAGSKRRPVVLSRGGIAVVLEPLLGDPRIRRPQLADGWFVQGQHQRPSH